MVRSRVVVNVIAMRIQDPKDPNIDYQIRDLAGRYTVDVYEASKWDGHRYPIELYVIKNESGKWSCTCPAAYRSPGKCKHVIMVQDYVKAGKPATFPQFEKLETI